MDKGRKQHVKQSALQNYGINLGSETRRILINKIENNNGSSRLLEQTSDTKFLYAVFYEERWIPVIYDERAKDIITFLPPEDLVPYHERLSGERKWNPCCFKNKND